MARSRRRRTRTAVPLNTGDDRLTITDEFVWLGYYTPSVRPSLAKRVVRQLLRKPPPAPGA